MNRGLFTKAVEQGRSQRRGEAYPPGTLSLRTPRAGFFNSLHTLAEQFLVLVQRHQVGKQDQQLRPILRLNQPFGLQHI